MECEVTSKTYHQLEVVPSGATVVGEVELFNQTHGFYMTAFTAAMLALNESATLITEAENVKVTKASGQTWVSGQWVYWDEGSSNFTIIPASDRFCVGKVQRAAVNGAVIGFIQMQDNYHPMQIGTTAVPKTIVAGRVVDIHVTSSQNSGGNAEPFVVETILTGAGATGGRALFKVSSEVNLGGWINALKGILELGTDGQVQGLGSGICAELVLPSGGLDRGTLTCLELEMVAAGALNGHPTSLVYAQVSGAESAGFGTAGYFLDYVGPVEASGGLFDTDKSAADTGGLRIRVNGNIRYLVYCSP